MRAVVVAGMAIVLTAFLSACGTPMPLSAKTRHLDLSRESIALFTLQQTREGNRTMPWPRSLTIRSAASGEALRVAVDSTFMDYGDDSRTYVTPLRLSLPPGKYWIETLSGTISAFPFQGVFHVRLGMEFTMPAQSVVYLGRVHAHMRERAQTEVAAGPILPLVSQAALGISTSTFDVRVIDATDSDVAKFREHFPVLANADIAKLMLADAHVPTSPSAVPENGTGPAPQAAKPAP